MKEKYQTLNEKFPGGLAKSSMRDTDYHDKKVYWYHFEGAKCPICGHHDWCLVNVTGTKVICMRKANQHRIDKVGGYLYQLDQNQAVKYKPDQVKTVKTFSKANNDTLDLMNRLVLQAYPLTQAHIKQLLKRGLSLDQIKLHGDRGFGSYVGSVHDSNGHHPLVNQFRVIAGGHIDSNGKRTFVIGQDQLSSIRLTSLWEQALRNLQLPTDSWHGVPGFYTKKFPNGQELPTFSGSGNGVLVPYYNAENQLIGFQIRVDSIKKVAKLLNKPKHDRNYYRMNFEKGTEDYQIIVSGTGEDQVIAQGNATGKSKVSFTYHGAQLDFSIKRGGKYLWVSSTHRKNGAEGKTPVQVAYHDSIGSLKPYDPRLESYIQQPKAVWLTEGGLKALVATANLHKAFNDQQLQQYGKDFLAVAGVSSYHKFLPVLKQLHVSMVTLAFDMDLMSNDQVLSHYLQLINLLLKDGYHIQMAVWDGEQAKGIDDALVANVPISFITEEQLIDINNKVK